MGNFLLGFKALSRIWGDAAFAESVDRLMEGGAAPQPAPVAVEAPKPAPAPETQRNDALSLLSVLQREARFVDFLNESIDGYSDAEVGAVVRNLHKECNATLERLFAIKPLSALPEDAAIEVPAGFDPAQFRLVGNIPLDPPFKGKVAHPGWKATRCDVPVWKGPQESARVIAPVEVAF